MNWPGRAAAPLFSSGPSIPSMCVARPIFPPTGAPKPPRNFRRFSIAAGSWSAIPSALWRACNWAERSPWREIGRGQRLPTRISSPFGKTPTPTSRSSSKRNRNTPGCRSCSGSQGVAIGNEGRYGFALDHLKIHSLRGSSSLRIAGRATGCGALVSCGGKTTPWRFLTAAEGRTLDAICEQIIPTDQTRGATWAGVVHFIDRQLMGPYRRQQNAYRSGLVAIDEAAAARFGKSFVSLDAPQQTAVLQTLTGGAKRFFSTVIAHTMQGYYGDPRH